MFRYLIVIILLLPMGLAKGGEQLAEEVFSLSLEELLNVRVSIASRNKTAAFENPAAVYVITQADIRASGMRSIPELLRMVPGLHVSRFSGGQWAVSSRNKTRRFSGYLLVAMDGRALHNPLFGGVFWDVQHTPLVDIERIEIVRGPGATTWGTKAVNGVINIITKQSFETLSTVISAGVGRGETTKELLIRQGFEFGNFTGRAYINQKTNDSGDIPASTSNDDAAFSPPFDAFNQGADARDHAEITQAGFRLDRRALHLQWLLQGDVYQGETGEYDGSVDDRQTHREQTQGFNLLTRLESQDSEWGDTVLQLYWDQYSRENHHTFSAMDTFEFSIQTADIDLQHYVTSGNHRWAMGLGFRLMTIDTEIEGRVNQSGILIAPASVTDRLPSAYLQDTISTFDNRVQFTLGIKAEKNDYSGVELQPTVRAVWLLNAQQNIWMAYSVASKSPVLLDHEAYSDDPALSVFDADPAACEAAGQGSRFGWLVLPLSGCVVNQSIYAGTQQVKSTELGYRWRAEKQSIDIALFYDDYEEQEFIVDTFVDAMYGIEFSFNYHINESWQALLNYSHHQGRDNDFFSTADQFKTSTDISKNTVYFRLSYQPINRWLIYNHLYFVDDIDGPVDAYTRWDMQLQWIAGPEWVLSLTASNLLDDSHVEENVQLFSIIPTSIRRGFFFNVTYEFGAKEKSP